MKPKKRKEFKPQTQGETMWTKIKEIENPNPKHNDAQRGQKRKKKRESKPQKPWGPKKYGPRERRIQTLNKMENK